MLKWLFSQLTPPPPQSSVGKLFLKLFLENKWQIERNRRVFSKKVLFPVFRKCTVLSTFMSHQGFFLCKNRMELSEIGVRKEGIWHRQKNHRHRCWLSRHVSASLLLSILLHRQATETCWFGLLGVTSRHLLRTNLKSTHDPARKYRQKRAERKYTVPWTINQSSVGGSNTVQRKAITNALFKPVAHSASLTL